MQKEIKWYKTKLAAFGGTAMLNGISAIISLLNPHYAIVAFGISIVLSVILILIAFLRGDIKDKIDDLDSHNKTAITIGNNSPAILGNNNTLITGISDEGLKRIRDGMLAVEKQKRAELNTIFNLGYILFTATERNEIVPLGSPIDDILKIDWRTGYNVSFSDGIITISLPKMIFQSPNSLSKIHFACGVKVIMDKQLGRFVCPVTIGNYGLAFKVVAINQDSVIIAMGIQFPLLKKSLKEKDL